MRNLPLFYEKSATPAMVRHDMDVQQKAIEYLNPGQIPVTTFDQPLFALCKICAVEMAEYIWCEEVCSYAQWFTHRNGPLKLIG